MEENGAINRHLITDNDNISDVLPDIQPGACGESMLVTTDSFEEIEKEMNSSFDERNMYESVTSTISEIQDDTTLPGPSLDDPVEALSEEDHNGIQNDDMVRIWSNI